MEKRTKRPSRGRVSAFEARQEMELRAPDLQTGMLDGYAQAIQNMGQSRRDAILSRIGTKRSNA